jgi:hypothetical protein
MFGAASLSLISSSSSSSASLIVALVFLSLIVALVFLSLIVAVVVLSLSLPSLPCLQVCAWTNATLGASSGCGVSNSAEVSAYQIGLYLTLPAMLVAGLFFLAAARWQPADHKARKHNSPVFVTMALAHRLLPVTRDPCDSFLTRGNSIGRGMAFYARYRQWLRRCHAAPVPGGMASATRCYRRCVHKQAIDRSSKQTAKQAAKQATSVHASNASFLPPFLLPPSHGGDMVVLCDDDTPSPFALLRSRCCVALICVWCA